MRAWAPRLLALAFVLQAAPASRAGEPAPTLETIAAQSGYARTGRIEEVDRLCRAFASAHPRRVRCETFGRSPEGRVLWALVASADGTLTPAAARARNRPVVFAEGGIHAGEIDGKDAGFEVLRQLLAVPPNSGPLAKVTLVFVPVFNVDGHERFGAYNRPNQRGPEAMGWRVTGNNLNLNRDFTKVETPEMRALLTYAVAWDPLVFCDLHTTDGADFQYDVAVTVQPATGGQGPLFDAGVALSSSLQGRLAAAGHRPLPFYPQFIPPRPKRRRWLAVRSCSFGGRPSGAAPLIFWASRTRGESRTCRARR